MRRHLRFVTVAFVVLGWLSPAGAATFFDVTNPGPLNNVLITTSINNLDGFDLLSATFDTSGTTAIGGGGGSLVIDSTSGAFNVVNPAGGTSVFTLLDIRHWKFDFTGFNSGDAFSFGWDPDTASDPNYSAVVSELVGMKVTLVTTAGTVSGTVGILDQSGTVGVRIASPVPEPGTLLLLGLGALASLGIARRIRAK